MQRVKEAQNDFPAPNGKEFIVEEDKISYRPDPIAIETRPFILRTSLSSLTN